MSYHYLTQSIGGFIQQTAVCYLQRGYWFYVLGDIPKGKDPERIDQKLLEKYQIGLSKYQRYRRKKLGQASLQYIRYQNTFLLLSTKGEHLFFTEEQSKIQDARRHPLRVFGYSLTYRDNHALVSLDKETYRNLEAYFLEQALHRKADTLIHELRTLPYEPYTPVYRQLISIWKGMNERRQQAGFSPLPSSAVRRLRKIHSPFGKPSLEDEVEETSVKDEKEVNLTL